MRKVDVESRELVLLHQVDLLDVDQRGVVRDGQIVLRARGPGQSDILSESATGLNIYILYLR